MRIVEKTSEAGSQIVLEIVPKPQGAVLRVVLADGTPIKDPQMLRFHDNGLVECMVGFDRAGVTSFQKDKNGRVVIHLQDDNHGSA